MAKTFAKGKLRNVSTVTTLYTVPASTTSLGIGCLVTNVDASATVNVTVDYDDGGAVIYNLVKNVPILPGSALEVFEGRVVFTTGEFLRVTSTGGLVDVTASFLENT